MEFRRLFTVAPGLPTSLLQTDKSYLSWVGKISGVTGHPGAVTVASLQSFVPCILVLRLGAVNIEAVHFCSPLHLREKGRSLFSCLFSGWGTAAEAQDAS